MKNSIIRNLFLPAAVATLILAAGCEQLPARINHTHNAANQQVAEKALAAFQEYTSDASGLPTTLLKNLAAETGLARTVAKAELEVAERGAVVSAVERTWSQLREDMFEDVGIFPTRSANEKAGNVVTNADVKNLPTESEESLHSRFESKLAVRMDDVTFICASLTTLVDLRTAIVKAESVTVKSAEAGVSNLVFKLKGQPATPAVTNSPPAGQEGDSLWGTLIGLEKAISDAYTETIGTNSERKAQLQTQAKALADMISQERHNNLASLKALVPLVGSGLDTNSMGLLHAFRTSLAEKVKELSPKAGTKDDLISKSMDVGGTTTLQEAFSKAPLGKRYIVKETGLSGVLVIVSVIRPSLLI